MRCLSVVGEITIIDLYLSIATFYLRGKKYHFRLSENFVEQEDASIARQEMYRYYCDCCQRNNESPCNQASFGKVVRIVFPCIKTRRLGVRGHSRYISPNCQSLISKKDKKNRIQVCSYVSF